MPKNSTLLKDLKITFNKFQGIAPKEDDKNPILNRANHEYHYKTFSALKTILTANQDPKSLAKALKQFLADNWQLVKQTALCYTAQPDSPMTQCLCEMAKSLVTEENASKRKEDHIGIMSLLMPGVSTNSVQVAHPELAPHEENGWTDIDIAHVLKTHVLGSQAQYLVPINCINFEDSEQPLGFIPIPNPYFDIDTQSEDKAYLSQDDIQAIANHSANSRAVYEALDYYSECANANLLGKLRFLSKKLHYFSKNGIGTEEVAGEGFAAMLCTFFEYWDNTLSDEDKDRIPDSINNEIESIREHTGNSAKLGAIESCLATRRTALNQAMSNNEELLATLGGTTESVLTKAKADLKAAKEALEKSVKDKTAAQGRDHLGLPPRVLKHLNIKLKFDTLEDLDQLELLTAPDIKELCCDPDYHVQIVDVMGMLENMVIFSQELPPHKLESFLAGVGDTLRSRYYASGEDYSCVTMSLDEERQEIYWKHYQATLPSMIDSYLDFECVFSVLTASQREALFPEVKPKLKTIITSWFDVADVLKHLDIPMRKEVIRELRQTQPLSSLQLCFLSPKLSKDRLNRFYDNLEKRLDTFTPQPDDFWTSFYWMFFWELTKVACLPFFKKLLVSPFQSPGDVIKTIGLPFMSLGLTILCATWAGYVFQLGVKSLFRGNFYDAGKYISMGSAIAILVTPLLMLMTALVTLVMAISLTTRTAASLISMVLPSKDDNDVAEDEELAEEGGFRPAVP